MRVIFGIALVCAAALAACGGEESPQSPTGLWGFGSSDPGFAVAVINSAGQAIFYTGDGEIFTGTAQMSGSTLTVAVEGYSQWSSGLTFSDGSTHGTGEVSGTVRTGGTISASLSFTTDGGTVITADWSLPYYSFDETSSLSDIAGIYGQSGTAITIDSSGAMNGPFGEDGCVMTGSISTGDPAHNVYVVSYSFSGCSCASQGLNGVQFTGLAFNSTNDVPGQLRPPQVTLVATGASATAKYGMLLDLVS